MSSIFQRRRNISATITPKNENDINEKEIVTSIRREIKKKTFKNDHIKELSKYRISSFIQSFDLSGTKRDLYLITTLLKKIPLFSEFIHFYNIPDESLEIFANNITQETYTKNQIICKQGHYSDFFYCVLQGTVKLTKEFSIKKVNDDKSEEIQEFTEDIVYKTNGYWFGQKDLIFKRNYSYSLIAVEDCEILLLDRDTFKQCFYKYIGKKEMEERTYVRRCLCSKSEIGFLSFESLYDLLIPITFIENPTNLLLFKEGDKANKIFIIVRSSFLLCKNGMNILSLIEGNVIGIESLFEEEKYLYTVRAYNAKGMVYSLDITKLSTKILNKLKKNFNDNYDNFKQIVKDRAEAKESIAKYEKIEYNIGKEDIVKHDEKIHLAIGQKFLLVKQRAKSNFLKFNHKKMKTIKNNSISIKTDNSILSQSEKKERESLPIFRCQTASNNRMSSFSSFVLKTRSNCSSLNKQGKTYMVTEPISPIKNSPSSYKRKNVSKFRLNNKIIVSEGMRNCLLGYYKRSNKKKCLKIDTGMFQIPFASQLLRK